MLGPIEDMMNKVKDNDFQHEMYSQLELVHRNSLRLLKLVNNLLDFSQLEAGKISASFSPCNLSVLTEDLASIFRAACEKAGNEISVIYPKILIGLELVVECEKLPEFVYADPEMYEKIILNLLSNAYKFTMSGHITVRLKDIDRKSAQLSVEDSGTGMLLW